MTASGSEPAPQPLKHERKNNPLDLHPAAREIPPPGSLLDENPGSTLSGNQQSTALFERYEKAGKDYFTGMKRYGPVDIPMSAERARMIIEKGGPAILFTPKAPYRQEGVSRIEPTYSSAHEVIDHVRFIHADTHCALLLDEHENVFAAFGVR